MIVIAFVILLILSAIMVAVVKTVHEYTPSWLTPFSDDQEMVRYIEGAETLTRERITSFSQGINVKSDAVFARDTEEVRQWMADILTAYKDSGDKKSRWAIKRALANMNDLLLSTAYSREKYISTHCPRTQFTVIEPKTNNRQNVVNLRKK